MLVILVLLQAGKEGMGVIFGGGSSSVFGSSGAGGILAKLTAFMAVIFIFTSLSYTYVTSVKPVNESVILDVKLEEVQPAPAKPAVPAPASAPAAQTAPAAPADAPVVPAAPVEPTPAPKKQ